MIESDGDEWHGQMVSNCSRQKAPGEKLLVDRSSGAGWQWCNTVSGDDGFSEQLQT